jgi:hypothetical protein
MQVNEAAPGAPILLGLSGDVQHSAGPAGGPGTSPAAVKDLPRKIIYTVSLDIAVAQFDGVNEQVEKLVRQHAGAYISEATVSGMKGTRRSGQWTIRVPQDAYDTFTAALRGLGDVRDEKKHSDEVTDEFYDLSARIKSKKETESRLLEIQKERTGGLDQVLVAEREIARVREEIERLEGQRNRLDNLSSLATVKLSVGEIVTYQAEQPLAFTARVSGTWHESLEGLQEFGEGLAIFLVAITPWLPIWLILALAVRYSYRRLLPRRSRPATA